MRQCNLETYEKQTKRETVDSSWVLYAFFVVIVKLLKTNQIYKTMYNIYKMLIYSIIIIVQPLGNL